MPSFSLDPLTRVLLLVLVSSFLTSVIRGDFQKCTPAYCQLVIKCQMAKCNSSREYDFGHVPPCGCCNRCVRQLEEKSNCLLEMRGNMPDTQCGSHLRCVPDSGSPTNAVCKKIGDVDRIGCEYKRKLMETNRMLMVAGSQPECDDFGAYQPKQCKNGTLCQCVALERVLGPDSKLIDIKTRPIFGLDIYTNKKKMNCLCSQQFENANLKFRELTGTLSENLAWTKNLQKNSRYQIDPKNFIRCQANGNYEPFQYYGNFSYCINEKTGQIDGRPVRLQHAKDLPCYNKRRPFLTSCLREYNSQVKNFAKLREQGFMVVNEEFVRCDLDGSYAPVQCQNDRCFCVNKNGDIYEKTAIHRNDYYYAWSQQCGCIRHKELIRQIKKRDKITEMFSKYQCDINGNYLPLQCSNTDCYCVDPLTGLADDDVGLASGGTRPSKALKTEKQVIRNLFCYTSYPDKQRLNEKFDL